MRFSIIVPVYNIERYIGVCIESILQQTYTDIEIIIINDGSVDNSLEQCNKYIYDKRVKIHTQKNCGAALARNKGIKLAKGEYLLFVDGDDYLKDADAIMNINNQIVSDVDACFFNYATDFDGKISPIPGYKNNKSYSSSLEYLEDNIESGLINVSLWIGVFKRKYILEQNIFLENMMIAEDIDWFLRFYELNPKIQVINQILYVHRLNRSGSLTSNICNVKVNCYIELVEKWINHPYQCTALKDIYFNYIAYQYCILLSIMSRKNSTEKQRKDIYHNIYLLEHNRDFRVARMKDVANRLGVKNMILISKCYLFLKKIGLYRMTKN